MSCCRTAETRWLRLSGNGMSWYIVFFLVSLLICLSSLANLLIVLVRTGDGIDYAPPSGSAGRGIQYSFTGAMSPSKKESAFLHLPTYTAGLAYHLGTFLSVFLVFLLLADVVLPSSLAWGLAALLMATTACGLFILVKRMVKKGLRELSSPDDYISNILVTGFQLITALSLIQGVSIKPLLFTWAGILLLYIPLGKLKHLLYFFAARRQLGIFYGRRGVWPPSDNYKP